MYDRGKVACHLCFNDKVLRGWIKEETIGRGKCPWCGRRGHLIYLTELAEPFREVVELYTQASGPSDALERGELIGDLLDYEWGIFSGELVDTRQELAVAILTADLHGKELYDHPDYEGLFFSNELSLEEAWDTRAYAALKGEIPKPPYPEMMGEQRGVIQPIRDRFLRTWRKSLSQKTGSLYRARLYDDRHHKEIYRC